MVSIELSDKLFQKIEDIRAEHTAYNNSEIAAVLIELGITMMDKIQTTPDVDKTQMFSMLLSSLRKKYNPKEEG